MDSLFQAAVSKMGASSLDCLEKGFQALQKDAQLERPSKKDAQLERPSTPEPESDSEDSSCNIEEAASVGSAAKDDPYAEVPSPDAIDLASSSSSSSSDSPAPSGLTADTMKRLQEEGDELNYSALKKMLTDSLPPDQRPKRDNKTRPRGGKKITRKKAKKKLQELQMEQEAAGANAKSSSACAKVPTPVLQTPPAPVFEVNVAAFKAAGLPVPPAPRIPHASAPAAPKPPAVPKRSNLSAPWGDFQRC